MSRWLHYYYYAHCHWHSVHSADTAQTMHRHESQILPDIKLLTSNMPEKVLLTRNQQPEKIFIQVSTQSLLVCQFQIVSTRVTSGCQKKVSTAEPVLSVSSNYFELHRVNVWHPLDRYPARYMLCARLLKLPSTTKSRSLPLRACRTRTDGQLAVFMRFYLTR